MRRDRAVEGLAEAARAEARHRAHLVADIDHLLLAALAVPAVRGWLTRDLVSLALLREQIEEHLAALPSQRAYREHVEPTLASDAALLLGAVTERSPLARLFLSDARALVRVLSRSDAVQARAAAARWNEEPLRALRRRAVQAARKRAHRNVLVTHVLLALLDDDRFARAMRAVTADVDEARSKLEERIQGGHRAPFLAPIEQMLLSSSVKANAAGRRDLGEEPLVVDLLRNRHVLELMGEAGVPPFELLCAYVHGDATPPVESGLDMVEVVFVNDDHTTQEAVASILHEIFGYDRPVARALMDDVHRNGAAVVATLAADDARSRVDRALDRCARRMMPLRILTRPPVLSAIHGSA